LSSQLVVAWLSGTAFASIKLLYVERG